MISAFIESMNRKTSTFRNAALQSCAANAPNAPKDGVFGPDPHNAWATDAAGISLVRTPIKPQPLCFEATPQGIEIDIARSAVIVIDMQNDFCHAEGWFAQKGLSLAAARKPIPALQKLLPAWRMAGGKVLWLNWGIRADRLNLSPTIQFKAKKTPDGVGYAERSPIDRGPSLVRGEWGAQVVEELVIDAADITVLKHRLSGFWDNELDSILRLRGATTLLFAGVNTDRCVFSTLQDAGFLGYDCVLLEDACSTPSPAFVTKAIHHIVQQLHGFTARSTDIFSSLAVLPQQHRVSSTPTT